jgi:hypothetical protein
VHTIRVADSLVVRHNAPFTCTTFPDAANFVPLIVTDVPAKTFTLVVLTTVLPAVTVAIVGVRAWA